MSDGYLNLRTGELVIRSPSPLLFKDYVLELSDGVTLDARAVLDDVLVVCGALRRARRKNITHRGKPIRGWRPELTVVRSRRFGSHGKCRMSDRSIRIVVGRGVGSIDVVELILHEATHAVLGAADNHGRKFKMTLCRAAAEYFGIEIDFRELRKAYDLDDLIIVRAAAAGWTPQCGRV